MVYWNFYLDFGPLNLGHLYRYCMLLNAKLNDKKLRDKVIYYYSSTHVHKRTNAAFLICAWALLYLNKSPEDAFKPFRAYPHPFPPWVSGLAFSQHASFIPTPCLWSYYLARCHPRRMYLQPHHPRHTARSLQGARVQILRLHQVQHRRIRVLRAS